MKRKYGIKRLNKLNWCIYSNWEIESGKEKGKIAENIEGYYVDIEVMLKRYFDFKIGKKLIGKDMDEKRILKEIKKAKKEILIEVKNLEIDKN